MRRLPLCFFLIAFFAPFAFADGTVTTVSRVIPSDSSNSNASQTSTRTSTNSVSRAQTSRTTTAAQTAVPQNTAETESAVSARTTSNRSLINRTTSSTEAGTADNVIRVGSRVVSLDNNTTTSSPQSLETPHTPK